MRFIREDSPGYSSTFPGSRHQIGRDSKTIARLTQSRRDWHNQDFMKVADEIGAISVMIFITGFGGERNERGNRRDSQTSVYSTRITLFLYRSSMYSVNQHQIHLVQSSGSLQGNLYILSCCPGLALQICSHPSHQ